MSTTDRLNVKSPFPNVTVYSGGSLEAQRATLKQVMNHANGNGRLRFRIHGQVTEAGLRQSMMDSEPGHAIWESATEAQAMPALAAVSPIFPHLHFSVFLTT